MEESLLSMRLPENKLIWVENTTGVFTIKSAYKITLDLSIVKEVVSSSNGDSLQLFWKRLWKIQTPHKIRHFA